jgi:hypothetical protein
MGTVIAYDCLKRVASCPRVDALMTIGSPLGLDEIQDALQPEWSRLDGFPSDRVAKRWVNVYDGLDPVAGFDGNLANDFMKGGLPSVEDIMEPNWGKWRHDISAARGAASRADPVPAVLTGAEATMAWQNPKHRRTRSRRRRASTTSSPRRSLRKR